MPWRQRHEISIRISRILLGLGDFCKQEGVIWCQLEWFEEWMSADSTGLTVSKTSRYGFAELIFKLNCFLVAIEPALDWLDDTFQPQVSHWHSASEVCMDSSDLVEYMSKEVLSSGTWLKHLVVVNNYFTWLSQLWQSHLDEYCELLTAWKLFLCF